MKVAQWLAQHPHHICSVREECHLLDMLDILLATDPLSTDIYVVDDQGLLKGHIATQVIFSHYLAEHQPVQSRRQMIHRVTATLASEMMAPHPVMAQLDDEVDDVLPYQLQQGITELAVVDEAGKLCGVINLYSVVQSMRTLDWVNELNSSDNP